jgi:hypothetical protein
METNFEQKNNYVEEKSASDFKPIVIGLVILFIIIFFGFLYFLGAQIEASITS